MGREAEGHAVWRGRSGALAAGEKTDLRVWAVHGRGMSAVVPDAAMRAAFRAVGWMNIKSSAVSEGFTATLYRPPPG